MPISGVAPFTIDFADTSGGAVTAWLWTFGDGDTSTSQHPSHTYISAGTYTVTLFATTTGGTIQQSDIVTVTVSGPAVAYTAPMALGAGLPGDDPQVMLRLSNDGGKTWISEQWRSAGKMGEYWRRVRWNRLGAARRRVFEVSVTDPVPWRLTGAYLEMLGQPGNGNG